LFVLGIERTELLLKLKKEKTAQAFTIKQERKHYRLK
jgi:hypothetical protein